PGGTPACPSLPGDTATAVEGHRAPPAARSPASEAALDLRLPIAVDPQVRLGVVEAKVPVVGQLDVELEGGIAVRGLIEAEIGLPLVQVTPEVDPVGPELGVGDGIAGIPGHSPVRAELEGYVRIECLARIEVAVRRRTEGAPGSGVAVREAYVPRPTAEGLLVAGEGALTAGHRLIVLGRPGRDIVRTPGHLVRVPSGEPGEPLDQRRLWTELEGSAQRGQSRRETAELA